jgi:hypothetical protein
MWCNISLTNRTVNFLTNMTVVCDRNSNGELNDQFFIVRLPENSFDYTSATYNSTAISRTNPTLIVPITSSSPRIMTVTILNLKNLIFIPNLNEPTYLTNSIPNISITTTQSNQTKIVGKASIDSRNFIPNDAYDIKNTTAVRSNIKSGDITNVTIQYATVLGRAQHVMQITLPVGQNGFSNVSGCNVGANMDLCNVVDFNATDMKIKLVPNSTVHLSRIVNFYPNANFLKIRIFTYP